MPPALQQALRGGNRSWYEMKEGIPISHNKEVKSNYAVPAGILIFKKPEMSGMSFRDSKKTAVCSTVFLRPVHMRNLI